MRPTQLEFLRAAVPRTGNRAGELEDAAWPAPSRLVSSGNFRCAVADGAGEASFSGVWARLLTRGYCRAVLDPPGYLDGVRRLGKVWYRSVFSPDLPWYSKEKLERGSFAAIAGIEVRKTRVVRSPAVAHWTALAVGDCCLFHVRRDKILRSFPLGSSAEFTRTPKLISTSVTGGAALQPAPSFARGVLHLNDQIILATDAFARWIFRCVEKNETPWNSLNEAFAVDGAFSTFVHDLRAGRQLDDDDVAVVRLRVVAGEDA